MKQGDRPSDATSHAAQPIRPGEPCVVCGRADWERRFGILLRCRCCGQLRADVDLDDPALAGLYGERYFRGGEYGDYLAERDVHRRNFQARYRQIEARAGRPRAVFEIGCAYGLWLEYLREQGVRAAGIDICPVPVRYAAATLGCDARLGEFLEHDVPAGQFDVFCLWDTLEHLPYPGRVAARVLDRLPPGGRLFATTADAGSRLARWRGRRWRMIHPPTHLHYFTAATARRLLARLGFADVSTAPVPLYRNLRSVLGSTIALRRGPARQAARLLAAVLPGRLQGAIGAWVNLGDVMLVSGRRPPCSV